MPFFHSLLVCGIVANFGQCVLTKLIVQVDEGQLQGIEKETLPNGKTIYAFLGLPYAKPPIGDYRFKAPIPIEKWAGTLDATKEGDICMQVRETGSRTIGSEDCLYLNVYTPQVPSSIGEKKAVMVFVHGGGFSDGSSAPFGPNYLTEYDVILVTLNYRLHIFGLLNTGTPNCSGNNGLKDQLLALKWVKKNISAFGGDTDIITLFGQSARAVSVHLHMLSPLSKGIFNKAMMQSGNALSPWAIEEDPVRQAQLIGRLTGYQQPDLTGLVQHLRNQAAETLNMLAHQCYQENKRQAPGRCISVMFVPSVERAEEGAFLTDLPERLMGSATPTPTIIGFNNKEGLALYGTMKPSSMKSLLDDISLAIRHNFAHLDQPRRTELLKNVDEFYFKNRTTATERIPGMVNLFTDLYFMKFYEAIDDLVNSNFPLYTYLFEYEGNLNMFAKKVKSWGAAEIQGAAHGDELKYMFKGGRTRDGDQVMSENDKEIIHHLCTLWTTFAKAGHPESALSHVDWKPHTSSRPSYLKIGQKLEAIDGKLHEAHFAFWKNWSKDQTSQ